VKYPKKAQKCGGFPDLSAGALISVEKNGVNSSKCGGGCFPMLREKAERKGVGRGPAGNLRTLADGRTERP